MAPYNFGVLYGDGIGPEISQSAIEILKAASFKVNVDIKLVSLPIGWTKLWRSYSSVYKRRIRKFTWLDYGAA